MQTERLLALRTSLRRRLTIAVWQQSLQALPFPYFVEFNHKWGLLRTILWYPDTGSWFLKGNHQLGISSHVQGIRRLSGLAFTQKRPLGIKTPSSQWLPSQWVKGDPSTKQRERTMYLTLLFRLSTISYWGKEEVRETAAHLIDVKCGIACFKSEKSANQFEITTNISIPFYQLWVINDKRKIYDQ